MYTSQDKNVTANCVRRTGIEMARRKYRTNSRTFSIALPESGSEAASLTITISTCWYYTSNSTRMMREVIVNLFVLYSARRMHIAHHGTVVFVLYHSAIQLVVDT